jgi:lipid A 3-O-deacylase
LIIDGPIQKKPMMSIVGTRIAILIVVVLSASPAVADTVKWNTIGIKAGIADSRSVEFFSKSEVYATFSLPWVRTSPSNWIHGAFIGVNAGALTGEDTAFLGSAGIGLFNVSPNQKFVITVGFYPTYLSRFKFKTEDFGGTLQFTSTIGFSYNFSHSMTIGYRFEHMSNANIHDENPGLNTHSLELGYHF